MKCEICGKIFTPNPRAHGQKYCGRNCYNIAHRKIKHSYSSVADKPIKKITAPPKEDFITIPKAPNYEMNSAGVVRNRSTGYILKWHNAPHNFEVMTLGSGKAKIIVSKPNLLWLLHGSITYKRALHIPCAATKGTRYLRFDSLTQCSKFLAPVIKISRQEIYRQLTQRAEQIRDWQIQYFNWG